MKLLPKKVHVIGICGVATSALAIAFHKAGVKVTGSDKGFFPPVSTELEKHGIPFYAGWHTENMTAGGAPDLIVVGTASGSKNPETAAAEEFGIPLLSFAEAIGRFFVRKHSIVVVGTWGKTSSAALLSHILDRAKYDPSYMFGGVSLSHDASARLSDSDWSVFEGDEYKSSPTDPKPKFSYYKPTHLLLTAVSWDHADLYPTEEAYFKAFEKLAASISATGFIVANRDHGGVGRVMKGAQAKAISYGKKNADYTYDSVKQSEHGLSFTVHHGDEAFKIASPMLGAYQAENITGCFAVAHSLGISPEKIISAVSSFQGLKRRMEKRLDGEITVIDDIAHSPEKATSVLETSGEIYKGKIIAVFEPNIGGREHEASSKYDHAFKNADIVIIPRLTKLKVAENHSKKPLEGDELAQIIAKTHSNTKYIDDDAELVAFLNAHAKKGDAIVFLGSHGFRGMIEETVEKLKS